MINRYCLFVLFFCLGLCISCSPIKSSSQEEGHQIELSLHEIKIQMDDLKHDIHCAQMELQIMQSRLTSEQNSMKTDLENLKNFHQESQKTLADFQIKIEELQRLNNSQVSDLRDLSSHANETLAAFQQYKSKLKELEGKIEEVKKLGATLQLVIHSLNETNAEKKNYVVQSGDSLEKIAKKFGVSIQDLRDLNKLDGDKIIIGQEIKLPKLKE